MAHRNYKRSSSRSNNSGYERARKHIAEAEALSDELGGKDKDVKEFFFNIDGAELARILDVYEQEYGKSPREYAESALPQWKSGRTKMSGLVASRLFSLLPKYMSITDKLSLAESLWKHIGPRSTRYIYIGKQATAEEVRSLVKSELDQLTTSWTIPDRMKKRFDWLAGGDVEVEQRLLAHIIELERNQSRQSATDLVTEFMQRYESQRSNSLALFRHTVSVGNQKLQIEFSDRPGSDCRDTPVHQRTPVTFGPSRAVSSETNWFGIGFFVFIGFVVLKVIFR